MSTDTRTEMFTLLLKKASLSVFVFPPLSLSLSLALPLHLQTAKVSQITHTEGWMGANLPLKEQAKLSTFRLFPAPPHPQYSLVDANSQVIHANSYMEAD